jgi:outer membrane protein OmpA-like peptidoglycan-associated protein
MFRKSTRVATRLTLAVSILSLLSVMALPAADDYVVPRIPTADREVRGNLAYIDNFFSGITGFGDNILDLVAGAAGIVLQTVGGTGLIVSDVVGLVDDNPITRTVTQGFVSTNIAELALIVTRTGDDYIEINHDLQVPGLPHYRETYLRQDDGGDGWNYIDYLHFKNGWACLIHVPVEIVAVAVGDGVVRPVGNVLRVLSCPYSDDLEKNGLDFIEWSLCKPPVEEAAPEPVVEIREVPVETEVVREVYRTVTTNNYTFRDVLFRYDDSTLTPMGERAVASVCEALHGKDITEIAVTGFCSSEGTDEYNMALGQRRADTVAAALGDCGLDRTKMRVESRGEADPVASNDTDVGRSLNRRVEVRVTYVEETEGSSH